MVSPPRLHVPAMGFAGGESVACTDSRLADCFAECVGQRMQRAPASTMTGDDVFDAECPQPLYSVGMIASITPPKCRPPITQ